MKTPIFLTLICILLLTTNLNAQWIGLQSSKLYNSSVNARLDIEQDSDSGNPPMKLLEENP